MKNDLSFNRSVKTIDNVRGLDGKFPPLGKTKSQKRLRKLLGEKPVRNSAKWSLIAVAAALVVNATTADTKAPKLKQEHDFSKDVSGDQMQRVQIAKGMTGQDLVQRIYAESHREGMPGPITLEDGPALVAAANYVNNEGEKGGTLSNGKATHILTIGKSVLVPVVTPRQAQLSAIIENQQPHI